MNLIRFDEVVDYIILISIRLCRFFSSEKILKKRVWKTSERAALYSIVDNNVHMAENRQRI